ncbi:hypothetical protein AMTR_s00054p00196940 [Amborella trichopoda]|uniref:Uncharacterized protein n=1 Tax=Amborella trichopoda TaxID=13333 RepID=U5DCQ8_AMBTC|nr:hypothetical protein AMTR_s00054p00196940 [Amborella trichopoda]
MSCLENMQHQLRGMGTVEGGESLGASTSTSGVRSSSRPSSSHITDDGGLHTVLFKSPSLMEKGRLIKQTERVVQPMVESTLSFQCFHYIRRPHQVQFG